MFIILWRIEKKYTMSENISEFKIQCTYVPSLHVYKKAFLVHA